MKKITALVLAPTLAFTLSACEQYPLIDYNDKLANDTSVPRQSETIGKFVKTEKVKRVNPDYESEDMTLYYDTGEYQLSTIQKEKLDYLVEEIDKMNGNYEVVISGHSDVNGSDKIKQRISDQRAFEVYVYLMSKSVRSFSIILDANSDRDLAVYGNSDYSDRKNRRVNITVNYVE
jgi:outer membrane protein OmpA-like peptidoglycan-associated protein